MDLDEAIAALAAASEAADQARLNLRATEDHVAATRESFRLALGIHLVSTQATKELLHGLYWNISISPGLIAEAVGCDAAQLHQLVGPLQRDEPCRQCGTEVVVCEYRSRAALERGQPLKLTGPPGICDNCLDATQPFLRRRRDQLESGERSSPRARR